MSVGEKFVAFLVKAKYVVMAAWLLVLLPCFYFGMTNKAKQKKNDDFSFFSV